ncbi:biotin attachment protein [bacterium]|nr:biotin attachment protein [bacterium]
MKLKITVHGVAYEVDVEVLDAKRDEFGPGGALPSRGGHGTVHHAPGAGEPPPPAAAGPAAPASAGSGVVSPIAGTIIEIKCKAGDAVAQGQELLIIEAMKMNTAISAPGAGTVKRVLVAAGDSVRENQQLIEFS